MAIAMFIMILLISSCKNKNMNVLDDKFLELYYRLEMQEYGTYVDFDKLSEIDSDIIYSRTRIKEINFDKDKNLLWCLSEGDGIEIIDIYDENVKNINYCHIFTTNDDEPSHWYLKNIDNIGVEASEEEAKYILKKFNELNVDSRHALNLIMNRRIKLPEYIVPKENENKEIILFGNYDQNMYISRIEWIVLYKDESKALLLSNKILDWMRMNNEHIDNVWINDLKHFLDEYFYNKAFTSKEQEAIIPNSFNEKVSLLTQDNINKYFKENSEYLKAKCCISAAMKTEAFKLGKYKDGYSDYWLRPKNEIDYSYINNNGEIELTTINDAKGVRPIIWVSLE